MEAEKITEALAAIDAITDPAERAQAATDALHALKDGNAALATTRRAAIEELHGQGWSYRRIGESIGVNHARVGQILSGEPTGVGVPGRKPKKAAAGDTDD